MTKVIAHRGNAGEAPENTLAAFRQAIELGADGVELDVQASREGVPVVIHDETLERTTDGRGPVAERSLAELQALDAGSWFHERYAGERIPSLEAVLELLRPTSLLVNIELKTAVAPNPGLAEVVIRQVEVLGLRERVVLSSSNHYTLLEARTLAPHVACAALVDDHMIAPWLYVRANGLQALHPNVHAVTPHLVKSCKQYGVPVRPYTVNDERTAARLMAWGLAGLITDHPGRLLALRGRPFAGA